MIRSRSTAAYSNSMSLAASFICFSSLAISAASSGLVSFLPDLFWASASD